MNPKIIYVGFFFSLLFLSTIFAQTGMSSVYAQDKPSFAPKSKETSPPPVNEEGNIAERQVPTDSDRCQIGTGPGTGKPCQPCLPGPGGLLKCQLPPISTPTFPIDKGTVFNKPGKPDIGGAGGGVVSEDISVKVQKLEKMIQELKSSNNDPSSIVGQFKELESLGEVPDGTTQKFNSLIRSVMEFEGTFNDETSPGGTSELACGWLCKAIVIHVAKKAVDFIIDVVTNPCPGSTVPVEGDGNPNTLECGPKPT